MIDLAIVVSTAMTTRNVPAGELSLTHQQIPKCITEIYLGATVLTWGFTAGLVGERDVMP